MKHLSLIVAIVGILGCAQEKFKPDKRDSRLPKYTERGNQVGGALINNIAWKTNFKTTFAGAHEVFYITNYQEGDSLVVKLIGEINEGVDKGKRVNLLFVIKELQLPFIQQTGKLNNVKVLLDGIHNYALIDDYYNTYNPAFRLYTGGVGELHIKSVKERSNVTITGSNGDYHPFIISGTFHFTLNQYGQLFEVRNGRFDFNFYKDNLELR